MSCSVCSHPDASVYVVGSVTSDLCRECVEGAEGYFAKWISERMRQVDCQQRAEARAAKRTGRKRLPTALQLIRRDGYVTTRSLCTAAGMKRGSAYNALWNLEKAGVLESDTFYGGEVRWFVAERRERAEAAE